MDYNELKSRYDQMVRADKKMFDIAEDNMQKIIDESYRVSKIAGESESLLNDLEQDFNDKTKLNSTDFSFLMLAVGLQMARQYLLSNDKYRISASAGDKLVKDPVKNIFPNAGAIIAGSVPYDAVRTSDLFNYSTGLSGLTHRYRTLGHDPILGWIIGPANIMTSSLTKYDFDTFSISSNIIMRRYPMNFVGMMNDFIALSKEHPDRLVASIAKQAIHFGSDYFTKQGLPIPLISTIDNNLAKDMILKGNIDMYSISRGATVAIIINKMIELIHKLFYNPEIDDERLYEVRTRKILLYANMIATSTNIGYVAFTKKFNKLDIGGFCVTIYRLISDTKYMKKIKYEFVYGEFEKLIIGNDLDLLEYTYDELLNQFY